MSTAIAGEPETIIRYNREWPGYTDLDIELVCFRNRLSVEDGGLGALGHFKEITERLWPKDNPKRKTFVHTVWSDLMIESALEHNYLSISGCANAGKSETLACYSLVQWLSDPINTLILLTSTSLRESRLRVWGSVESLYNGSVIPLPGKLVSSVGMLRLDDPTGETKTSDRSGLHLIAGEKRKERQAVGKLIGLKAPRVFLIADELAELSPALLEAAYSNLSANPFFQLIAASNPASIYDPHGQFSEPAEGWQSVTPDSYSWKTRRGFHIRFDAFKSPNVLAGRTIHPFLPTQAKIDKAIEDLGLDSSGMWRMYRGFWSPHGSEETIFSEAEIVKFDGSRREVKWAGTPIDVAGLDPAFCNDGDRSVLYFGKLGKTTEGVETLLFTDYEVLHENASVKDQPRAYQICSQFRDKCKARGITPDHAAFDATGAGLPFADIIASEWSRAVLPVSFGGKASLTPVSAGSRVPACDQFYDKVAEIWGAGKQYLKTRQLAGIGPDLGGEMVARKCSSIKGDGKIKLKVEGKKEMKARTGASPDLADAAFILLFLCRTRLHFRTVARKEGMEGGKKKYKSLALKLDVTSRSGQFLDPAGLPG